MSIKNYPSLSSVFLERKVWKDKLPGGEADKKSPADFDKKQLAIGIKSEMEHTNDKHIAAEIAMDHLSEDPEYYAKLKKMENESTVPWLGETIGIHEAKKLTGVTAEYAGFVPGSDWEVIHRKIEDVAADIDKEFVVTSSDLSEAFENFMAALGAAMNQQTQMKRNKR